MLENYVKDAASLHLCVGKTSVHGCVCALSVQYLMPLQVDDLTFHLSSPANVYICTYIWMCICICIYILSHLCSHAILNLAEHLKQMKMFAGASQEEERPVKNVKNQHMPITDKRL